MKQRDALDAKNLEHLTNLKSIGCDIKLQAIKEDVSSVSNAIEQEYCLNYGQLDTTLESENL